MDIIFKWQITHHYLNVYTALLDTLYIIIGMMITGGVVGYVGKRDNDVNK